MTKTHFVVTGVVKHKDKFLILKKAPNDRNYPNCWSFCSGFVKEFELAEDSCLREIKEETSLDAKIIKTGKIIEVIDRLSSRQGKTNLEKRRGEVSEPFDKKNNKRWVIAVYLCKVDKTDVKLCHENIDFKWVSLEELDNYEFVPGLSKDLKSLGLID